jgi:hypothetical protein
MKDWKKIAAGWAPEIPAGDLARVVPLLDALEEVFLPLMHRLPHPTEPAYIVPMTGADDKTEADS